MIPEIRRYLSGLGAAVLDRKNVTFNNLTEAEFYRKYPQIFAALSGGMPAWSGESVNRDTALSHSVVWAAAGLLSGTMGRLPASVMIEKDGEKHPSKKHPAHRLIHSEPNPEMSAKTFKEMLTHHCALDGDGFARIIRRSGTGEAIELWPLLPESVQVDREKQGRKRLVYILLNEHGAADKTYTVESNKAHDILHIRGISRDGMRGYNVLQMAKQSIGTAIAQERNIAWFWKNGGRLPYALTLKKLFKDDKEFEKFRADWEAVQSQPHRAVILEDGDKYETVGSNMKDSQSLESRIYTVSELGRWWRISPNLLNDHSHSTFSNIEHLYLEFKTITMAEWVNSWQQDWDRCVWTPAEKEKGIFLKFNLNAFLIGDFKARMEGYASALQNGHKNIDEVRDLEDLNPLPNDAGKPHHIQLNMGTVPGTGDPMPVELRQQQPATPPAAPEEPEPAPPTKSVTTPSNGSSRKSIEPAREYKAAIDEILTALRN